MANKNGYSSKSWTRENEARLKQLCDLKLGNKEIAKILNKTTHSINRKIDRYIENPKRIKINSAETRENVKEAYLRGDLYETIAKENGIDRQTVRRILQDMGLGKRKKYELNKYANIIPQEEVDLVKRLYIEENKSICETAKASGLSYYKTNQIIASRKMRKPPEDWEQWQVDAFLKSLEDKDSLLTICLKTNKTDFALRKYSKYYNFYNKYPVLHERLPNRTIMDLQFILNKFISIKRADSKNFARSCHLTLKHVFDILNRQNGKCFYTGDKLIFQPNHYNSVSIERLDSDKPHSPDNIVLCTTQANVMKQDYSVDEFLSAASKIHKNASHILSQMKEHFPHITTSHPSPHPSESEPQSSSSSLLPPENQPIPQPESS